MVNRWQIGGEGKLSWNLNPNPYGLYATLALLCSDLMTVINKTGFLFHFLLLQLLTRFFFLVLKRSCNNSVNGRVRVWLPFLCKKQVIVTYCLFNFNFCFFSCSWWSWPASICLFSRTDSRSIKADISLFSITRISSVVTGQINRWEAEQFVDSKVFILSNSCRLHLMTTW